MPQRAHYLFPVHLQLNGENREVGDGMTLGGLIDELELGGRRLAVEINREIIPRQSFAQHILHDGDVVEIVQFIGGG